MDGNHISLCWRETGSDAEEKLTLVLALPAPTGGGDDDAFFAATLVIMPLDELVDSVD